MNSHNSAGALTAAVLLLLPTLYVGSYYAVVDTDHPSAQGISFQHPQACDLRYRIYPELADRFYWPVEQVDRRLRPGAWEDPLIKLITSTIIPESSSPRPTLCTTGEPSASAP